MTKFVKENFDMGFGSERYVAYNDENGRRFIGRFKYMRPAEAARHFVKFLIANFTVEEYFDLTVNQKMAPLIALETKGYVSPNMARAIKAREEAAARAARGPMILIHV